MYHIFLIHSSVDGHLGCFHVLVIVNSAAMNIGVPVCFLIMVFSGYICPGVGLLDHNGNSTFRFCLIIKKLIYLDALGLSCGM